MLELTIESQHWALDFRPTSLAREVPCKHKSSEWDVTSLLFKYNAIKVVNLFLNSCWALWNVKDREGKPDY